MGLVNLNISKLEYKDRDFHADLWDWGKSLLIALVAVILTNQFIVTQCQVIGYSMKPTLLQGERLLINRLIYKFRAPHRGEIITFVDPDITQPKPTKNLVKRVIAISDDVVEVREGLLYVNGINLQEGYTDAFIEDEDWGPYTVSAGQVFVIGDNRHAKGSRDSRMFGAVSTKLIIGRAEFVLWPLKKIKHL
jgi:signal peptidase I